MKRNQAVHNSRKGNAVCEIKKLQKYKHEILYKANMNRGPPFISSTENSDALKLQNNTVSITLYAEIHSQKVLEQLL